MKGTIRKDQEKGWMIKFEESELPLHPDDVDEINGWDKIFDNVEARILSQPECDFEIVTGFNSSGPEHFPDYAKFIKEEDEDDFSDLDATLMDGIEEDPE
jgi:hypothetical protein